MIATGTVLQRTMKMLRFKLMPGIGALISSVSRGIMAIAMMESENV